MTINETQDRIIEEMSELDDWMDRYAYIIDLGNALPPIDEKYKTPEHLIEGCQSRVWLNADLYFIPAIGLSEHLSPTRSNGLLAMVKQMRMYAVAFKAINNR